MLTTQTLSQKVVGSKVGNEVERRTRAMEEDRDFSTCDLEVMSQSLILPPTDRPYFLLLQGYDQSKARLVTAALSNLAHYIIPASL